MGEKVRGCLKSLNLPPKAPATTGDFDSISPQIWGVRGAFKQVLKVLQAILLRI
jgi:hypothetical protein